MDDTTNKYLLSIVAIVAVTGLFLIFMNRAGSENAAGMVVGYTPEVGVYPQYDNNGNKLCTGRVAGDSIQPDYISGCHSPRLKIAGWTQMSPLEKSSFNKQRVVYMQVSSSTPGQGWVEPTGTSPKSLKGGAGMGGSGLPDQAVYNEAQIIELLKDKTNEPTVLGERI